MALSDIAFTGDIHGNITSLVYAAQQAAREGKSTLIQVGDNWLYNDRDIVKLNRVLNNIDKQFGVNMTIHFIDGNHEDFTRLNPHRSPQAGFDDATEIIPGRYIYHTRGSIATICGVNILFFGGAASIDRVFRTPGVDWFDDELPTWADCVKATQNIKKFRKEVGDIDVMVCHDTPERFIDHIEKHMESEKIEDPASTDARIKLDHVYSRAEPDIIVHGHWHFSGTTHYPNIPVTTTTLHRDRHEGCTVVFEEGKPQIIG